MGYIIEFKVGKKKPQDAIGDIIEMKLRELKDQDKYVTSAKSRGFN